VLKYLKTTTLTCIMCLKNSKYNGIVIDVKGYLESTKYNISEIKQSRKKSVI
jgi:hypothetical protein